MGQVGFVVGLVAEARLGARLGVPVEVGGGTAAGAAAAAARLVARGVEGLVSFGLAGGLDPALRAGQVLVPTRLLDGDRVLEAAPALCRWLGGSTPGAMLAGRLVVAGVAEKRALFARTGAVAVDLESGAVAEAAMRAGLGFAMLRAVCDPAGRTLPAAALVALDGAGAIGGLRVLGSVLRAPGQLPGLLALARDAAAARRGLERRVRVLQQAGLGAPAAPARSAT